MATKTNPSVVTTSFPLPGRNVYSLSHKEQFDTNFGIVRPFAFVDLNPFERLEVVPAALVKTLPALAPIMSRARCRIFAVWSPDKNYVSDYLTNRVDENVDLPQHFISSGITYETEVEAKAYDVQPNSLFNCIGIPIGFNSGYLPTNTSLKLSGLRTLAYYDFIRNYIVNRNEQFCFYQREDNFLPFDLSAFDAYFAERRWEVDVEDAGGPYISAPWYGDNALDARDDAVSHYRAFATGGLMLKPHMPDINSAFSSNSKFEEAIAKSIVRLTETAAGENGVSIQSIIEGAQIYNFYNKVLATGGQVNEMIRAEFGVDVTNDLDIPMFLRQWSFDLGFNDVVSQSATEDEPLGSLAGRGVGALSYGGESKEEKKRRRKNTLSFRSRFHGTMSFYFVIEPYAEYSDGLDPFLLKTRTLDKFWPSFDRAGWQPLPLYQLTANHNGSNSSGATEQYAPNRLRWKSGIDDPFSVQVGVQAAYTEYKGAVSRNSGNMAGNLRYWTFNRKYFMAPTRLDDNRIPDSPFNTYVFPYMYNNAWAVTDGSSEPFICSIGLDIKIKRPISRVQLNTAIV